jgi:hypothetical protein
MQICANDTLKSNEHIAGIVERMRREPALRTLVLTAPTRALAAFMMASDLIATL